MAVYTATVRSYSFGCGQEWDWDGVLPSGLGPGEYRAERQPKIGDDGSYVVGGDYADPGITSFALVYDSTVSRVTVEQAAARLRAAFAPERSRDLVELTLEMASGTFVLRGRPKSPTVDLSVGWAGFARALVSWETIDPLLYDSASQSVTVSVGGTSGGVDTPLVTPLVTTGSGSTGDATITNTGTASAPWTAYVSGPVTTPRLILGGQTVEILGDIPAGSVLTVDSATTSVRLDGAPRPWVSFGSTWWEIPPGTSTFSFRAAAGTGSAQLVWRAASW